MALIFEQIKRLRRGSGGTDAGTVAQTVLHGVAEEQMPVRLRLARFGRKVRLDAVEILRRVQYIYRRANWSCTCFKTASLAVQNLPFYRIFAADGRSPRDGKHIEILGHFDPVPGVTLQPAYMGLRGANTPHMIACSL